MYSYVICKLLHLPLRNSGLKLKKEALGPTFLCGF